MTTENGVIAMPGVNQHKLEVVRTKEYHLFSHLEGNRTINRQHVNRLVESMKEQYLVSPIIVNGKYEIIDGQHRFEAIKELGLPLLYIMVKQYGLEEVQRFNSNQKNFSYEDFANGYIDLGNEHYKILKEFRSKYDLDWGVSIALLTGQTYRSGADSIKFKSGEFKVKSYNKAVEIADKIAEIGQFYPGYTRKYFMYAAIKMINTPGYNQRHLIDKLRYLSTRLVDCTSTEDYLKLLENIYNFKTRSEYVRFLY